MHAAMTAIDTAERKSRLRAMFFYVLAAALLALDVAALGTPGWAFGDGLWAGLMLCAAVNLVPVERWLRPNSRIARLLEDESTREHRRMSSVAGFWAAFLSASVLMVVMRAVEPLSGIDVARVVATATVSAALISFATLELRATRG